MRTTEPTVKIRSPRTGLGVRPVVPGAPLASAGPSAARTQGAVLGGAKDKPAKCPEWGEDAAARSVSAAARGVRGATGRMLATLRARLPAQGTGAPSRLALAFALSLSALALTAAPALAAAPEAPELTVEPPVHATTATFLGTLSPKSPGELGSSYQFVYRSSTTSECKGAGEVKTPVSPGMSLGAEHEVLPPEPVTGLVANTEYAVCLLAENAAKTEIASSAAVAFKTALPPEEPETGKAEPVTNTTAVLHGTINPKALATASWFFEYSKGAACTGGSTTPAHPPEEVEAKPAEEPLSGLQPGTQYTFCVVARNEAGETTLGSPVSFTTTAVPPAISEEAVISVTGTEATLSALIDPEGLASTYAIEYGATGAFLASGESGLPVAEGPLSVRAHLTGLAPSTEYHFRFVAKSALGPAQGIEASFETLASGAGLSAATLPDGRTYELVSAPAGNSEVYVPHGRLENNVSDVADVLTERPFRAAADGSAIAFVGEPPGSGAGTGNQGAGFGDEWLARRASSGWAATDVQPSATSSGTEYQAFSSDLSLGFIRVSRRDHVPAEPSGPSGCSVLDSRTNEDGQYHALLTSTNTPGRCGGEYEPVFAGAAVDGSATFFQTSAPLVAGSLEAPGEGSDNLYVSVGGEVHAVNVLPDGEPAPNATFGGPSAASPHTSFDFDRAVSAAGDRAFWTDVNSGAVYLRINPSQAQSGLAAQRCTEPAKACTVPVSRAAAQYWTASADARYAFYTEAGKLFRFNLDKFMASAQPEPEALEEARELFAGEGLGSEPANVHGVLGASADGSYVYFVAGAVLASNQTQTGEQATVQACREAGSPIEENEEERVGNLEGGGCNLYVLRIGEAPRFIATLAPKDNQLGPEAYFGRFGDWQPAMGYRTASVTPDGRHLLFESRQRLTGYNNGGKRRGDPPEEPEIEVFAYHAEEGGGLLCASCNPTGAPAAVAGRLHGGKTSLPPSTANGFMRRWINDEGTRVFFDSSDALVPQDTNGVQDVYEWEQSGSGSCTQTKGCVYLLSGGTSTDNAFLLDASASGADAFFATRSELVTGVGDQRMKLFDAHECSAAAPCATPTSLACTGSGCQGVPPSSPAFATPPSATLIDALGNFTPAPRAKKLTSTQIKAKQLAKALKACRTKHNKHKRQACEAQARKRYGPPHKPRSKSPKGGK